MQSQTSEVDKVLRQLDQPHVGLLPPKLPDTVAKTHPQPTAVWQRQVMAFAQLPGRVGAVCPDVIQALPTASLAPLPRLPPVLMIGQGNQFIAIKQGLLHATRLWRCHRFGVAQGTITAHISDPKR